MDGLSALQWPVAGLAGLACGFLNTVASSGSVVSLPILMWVGLPPAEANATNRIPVLIGCVSATLDLARKRAIPWGLALRTAVPVTIGAAIGAVLAELLPGDDLGLLITGAVLLAFFLILAKLRQLLAERPCRESSYGAREFALLLAIGIWIGFIVLDGATYLLLALVLAVRLSLPEANAIKNFLLVPTSLVAIAIFATDNSIDWTLGLVMGAGSMVGGLLGAKLSLSRYGRDWISLFLTLVIAVELIHLSVHYYHRFIS